MLAVSSSVEHTSILSIVIELWR